MGAYRSVFVNVAIWLRNVIDWTIMREMRANTLRLHIFLYVFLGLDENGRPLVKFGLNFMKLFLVAIRVYIQLYTRHSLG